MVERLGHREAWGVRFGAVEEGFGRLADLAQAGAASLAGGPLRVTLPLGAAPGAVQFQGPEDDAEPPPHRATMLTFVGELGRPPGPELVAERVGDLGHGFPGGFGRGLRQLLGSAGRRVPHDRVPWQV